MPGFPKPADLQKLPFRLQVSVVVAMLALVGLGGYAGLVLPKNREIKTLRTQLAREEPEPIKARATAPPIGEEERKLWGQLEARLRQRFPAEKDLPGAVEAVADLARSAHMELVSLHLQTPPPQKSTPGAQATAGAPTAPVFQIPPPLSMNPTLIKLSVLHRYRDLVQFLDGLPNLPVAVTIESMDVRRVDNRLSTEMTLRTLRWGAS